ncbi:MAG: hypothetical protein ACPGYV_11630 [Phycisphaeraceae bacterium]
MKNSLLGSCLFVWFVLSAGCINPLPGSVEATASEPAAIALIEASAQAHGGDERFARVREIEVGYDGEWLGRVWVFQPILVDRGFRKASVETIRYADNAWPSTHQVHNGPEGVKRVRWPAEARSLASDEAESAFVEPVAGGAAVLYNGEPTSDEPLRARQEQAAAMVAEAYRMFLTAPFYFTQRAGRGGDGRATMIAVMSEPDVVDGVDCDQVLLEVRPGFGDSEVDRVQVAIGRDDRLVRRVRFSLEGFDGTRGATADIELAGHVDVAGLTLPTRFLEIVTHPIDREVHRWRAQFIGLQLDSPNDADAWHEAEGTAE